MEIEQHRQVACVRLGAAGAGDDEVRCGERGWFQRREAVCEHGRECAGNLFESAGDGKLAIGSAIAGEAKD